VDGTRSEPEGEACSVPAVGTRSPICGMRRGLLGIVYEGGEMGQNHLRFFNGKKLRVYYGIASSTPLTCERGKI
jgi:hypothetical protein